MYQIMVQGFIKWHFTMSLKSEQIGRYFCYTVYFDLLATFHAIVLQAGKKRVTSFFSKLGGYSQNFLRQILIIFVTLGLKILRFNGPKVFFQSKY
jgi:hypothetical protein